MVLCAFFGEAKTGYGFGKLAISLLDPVQCTGIQIRNSIYLEALFSITKKP
jgi:hypothetical protein